MCGRSKTGAVFTTIGDDWNLATREAWRGLLDMTRAQVVPSIHWTQLLDKDVSSEMARGLDAYDVRTRFNTGPRATQSKESIAVNGASPNPCR